MIFAKSALFPRRYRNDDDDESGTTLNITDDLTAGAPAQPDAPGVDPISQAAAHLSLHGSPEDWDKPTTGLDRGDMVVETPVAVGTETPAPLATPAPSAPPAPAAPAAPAASPAPASAPVATPTPEPAGAIPVGRFNEVLAERNALRAQLAAAQQQVAPAPTATPTPTAPPAPAFDMAAREAEYAELLADGEVQRAATLRVQINQHVQEQATTAAYERMQQEQQVAQVVQTMQQVANQAVADYPYLDTDEGAQALALIMELRDARTEKLGPAEALRQAVAAIAPRFAPASAPAAPATPGRASPAAAPVADTRPAAAAARGAAVAQAQPAPMTGGAGQRATAQTGGAVAIADMDDAQFEAMTPDQKRRARGDY